MSQSEWDSFLKTLNEKKEGAPIIFSLLKQLRYLREEKGEQVLGCSNHGSRFFLERKIDEITALYSSFIGKPMSIRFENVIEKKKAKSDAPLLSFQPSLADVFTRSGIHMKYHFDNFAVSSSNQVAFAAAQAVAESLGTAYNPLFLHGGVGVGKTHLAQAVARKILEEDADKKVFFCPGDLFTNELIESIREKSTPQFRRKYRKLGLLIVDDVQFIAGKQTVQEEFFHTFNSVLSSGGQIILTSDRPPEEIKNLEDRLRSRFSGGLTVDIQKPDFELRTAILLIKAREKNIEIDIESAKIIAERVTDTRALEGTLLSLYAKIVGVKERIDLDVVDQFFANQTSQKQKSVSIHDVVMAVSHYYNIKPAQLKGSSRAESVALPRQVIMYLLREKLHMKLEAVADTMKRKDHTTVIHAVDKISHLAATNASFREEIDRIIKSVSLST